jgi:hypothetical protein
MSILLSLAALLAGALAFGAASALGAYLMTRWLRSRASMAVYKIDAAGADRGTVARIHRVRDAHAKRCLPTTSQQ